MKKIHYILISAFCIVLLLGIYFVQIPSPSKDITEKYDLVIK